MIRLVCRLLTMVSYHPAIDQGYEDPQNIQDGATLCGFTEPSLHSSPGPSTRCTRHFTMDHQAWKELGLILLVVAIAMLMFSSLVFAFEQSGPRPESW